MTQTTNTQIDRIIKRTDEITEKELARQELPNPRTQTNTTQNKEELSKEVEERFEKQDFCFTDLDGNRKLHTNDDFTDEVKQFLAQELSQAHQSGIEEGAEAERKRIKTNIGFLRQWLNEKPEKMLVTNEDIEEWLFDFEPLRGNKQ